MTRAERRRRDQALVADRARGIGWAELATRHDVSERQARRIVEAWYADHPAVADLDPRRIVLETLAAFDQDLEDLAVLSISTENDAVKLGAIKARGEAFRGRVQVLREIGLLPLDWKRWTSELDGRQVVERFFEVLSRHQDAVPDDVVADLERALGALPPLRLTATTQEAA